MSSETQGLILGIAGMVSTLISSGFGLYFTACARAGPMRELLYSKQLDLAQAMVKLLGRARLFATLLVDTTHCDRAEVDIRITVKRFSILTDQAAALFPTEVFVCANQASNALSSVVGAYESGENLEEATEQFHGASAKLALMLRTLIGVDELSDESIRLFSTNESLARLMKIDPADILETVRDKDKPSE